MLHYNYRFIWVLGHAQVITLSITSKGVIFENIAYVKSLNEKIYKNVYAHCLVIIQKLFCLHKNFKM